MSVEPSLGHVSGAPRPDIDTLIDSAYFFSVELRSRFRGVTHREGLIFHGPSGWSEFAPFADYDDHFASRWLSAALEAAWGTWPVPVRDHVPVNLIVPAVSATLAQHQVIDAVESTGCSTVKVKVAGPETHADADVARVRAVRDALDDVLGHGIGHVRVDANAAWTLQQASHLLPLLDDAAGGLEYVEQPCASLDECEQLRGQVRVPIAVDEGVRLAQDLDDLGFAGALRRAADIVVLKAIPLGGVSAALHQAHEFDMPVVVSGSLDTSVGLASGVALAAALPNLSFACGLGTGLLLAEDVVTETALPHQGMLPVRRWEPRADRLHREIPSVWMQRLRGAYAALSVHR